MFQAGTGDAASPVTGTLYLSNLGYVDEASSPIQTYDETILAVPSYERLLDTHTLRGAAQVSLSGALSLNNAGGAYDFLLSLPLDGSECRVYVGDPSWARADFVHVFTALQAKVSAPSTKQLDVALTDTRLLLNQTLGGMVAVGGYGSPTVDGPSANKFRPLNVGWVHQIEPILIDPTAFIYAHSDTGTNTAAVNVRANGVLLTETTDWSDNGDGTLSLVNNPQSDQITCDVLATVTSGPSGQISAIGYRVRDVMTELFGTRLGLISAGRYTGTQYTLADHALNDYPMGISITEARNALDVLGDMMNTYNGFWAFTRLGSFYYGQMRPEALSTIVGDSGGAITVAAEIVQDDVVAKSLTIDHDPPGYASYQVNINLNHTTQNSFAGSLSADERDNLTRSGYLSAAYFGEEPDSTAYLGQTTSYLGGAPQLYHLTMLGTQVVDTFISGESDTAIPDADAPGSPAPAWTMDTYAGAWVSVHRSQSLPWKEFVQFQTFLDFYELEVGSIINVIYPRFDLDGGELHQVYRVSIDVLKARIDLGVVRRRFAAVTGAVPPYDFLAAETGDLILQEDGYDIIVSISGGTSVSDLLLVSGDHLLQLTGDKLLLQ